ncbi:MAG: hypothetical protein IPJ23_00150 [Ignavibacteriales bacterium]|nr:hypothetical protein [Ignavibacteriales bacterium]
MDEFKPAGNYEVEFNPYQLSSGIYFYRIAIYSNILQTGSIVESKKMLLVK